MSRVETITFQGVRFRRYPDADGWAERSYYSPGIADRQRGIGRLHEEIWKAEHGPIPDGYHVHHIDHDPLNNDLANLACITAAEHKSHHSEGREDLRDPEWLDHLDTIRPKAIEWHRSDEGRAWHREHGARTWHHREVHARTCEHCGEAYETRSAHGHERFCSDRCRAAARRASGVDDVERACECCGSAFMVNRYESKRFCGRSCAVRHSARRSCGCH